MTMSGVRIASRLWQREGDLGLKKSYCARLYYCSCGVHSWEVDFVITWDLELHIAVSIQVIVWNLES